MFIFGEYRTTPATLTKNKDRIPLQCDASGKLLTSSVGSGGSAGPTTVYSGFGSVIPELQYLTTRPTLTDTYFMNALCDSSGALLVNPGIYNTAPVQTAVTVAVTSTSILAANPARSYLMIQNQDGTNPMWVKFGTGATANNACIKILPNGVLIYEGSMVPNTVITGISTGGSVACHVTEAS